MTFSMATSSLDHWREVFRAAGESDVFQVIREGIRVAASDHPDEFRIRKGKIAQMLFTALPSLQKPDKGLGNAIEKKEVNDGCGNAVKSIELKAIEEEEEEEEEEEDEDEESVFEEEKTETTESQGTWKIVSVSENGNIRLRKVVPDHDPTTKASEEPQTTTFIEHHHDDEEGHSPRNDIEEGHSHQPEEGSSLRSHLEAAKRRVLEGFRSFEPRPKKFCRRPPLRFNISGARLR